MQKYYLILSPLVLMLFLGGCATVGEPRMIGPDTYTVVGSGVTNGLHNMEDEFLEKMQSHCQALGKYPLLRQNGVDSRAINVFGDKQYSGSLIYECITAAEYNKSNYHFDEVMPIQRIEKKNNRTQIVHGRGNIYLKSQNSTHFGRRWKKVNGMSSNSSMHVSRWGGSFMFSLTLNGLRPDFGLPKLCVSKASQAA